MSRVPLRISRSGLKLFVECPRCFWLEQHHKVRRPPGYPYTLSAAVDFLVKQEFDVFRLKGELPPVLVNLGINAKLYPGPELIDWRNNFRGINHFNKDLGVTVFGAVDDVLQFSDGTLAVIDYKSSGSKEVTIYDDYQKQMEVYHYILDQMGRSTHPKAYFVFFVVLKDGGGFKNALPFREEVRAVDINNAWVAPTLERACAVARDPNPPEPAEQCNHCMYVQVAGKFFSVPADKKITKQLPLANL